MPGAGLLPVRAGPPAPRALVLTELDGGVCPEEDVGSPAVVADGLDVPSESSLPHRRGPAARGLKKTLPELVRVEIPGAGKRPRRERGRQEACPA